VWTEGDDYLQQLSQLGKAVHQELTAPIPNENRVNDLRAAVESLNERFPRLEHDFSSSLGVAARYARFVVFAALAAVAALALLLGLPVSYRLMMRARDEDLRYRLSSRLPAMPWSSRITKPVSFWTRMRNSRS
jgi:hypothetical protein